MAFLSKKQDPHKHDYTKLGYIREVGTSKGGQIVNRIILTRSCACGESQAFECGDKQTMRQLYAKLKKMEASSENDAEHIPGPVQQESGGISSAGKASSA